MPIGFCCTHCYLYDEMHTCLNNKLNQRYARAEKIGQIKPLETRIEGDILRVIIEKEGEKIPIIIDLNKQFGNR